MKFNPGRLCAFFIALIFSQAANAGLLFTGDFETGAITSLGSSPSGTVDVFSVSNMKPNPTTATCISGSINSTSGVRIVTNPVRTGNYAVAQSIWYDCDYRPLNGGKNGGTTGLQKPREGLTTRPSQFSINNGTEYWISFSVLIPSDTLSETNSQNPDNLFQLVKDPTSPKGSRDTGANIMELNWRYHNGASYLDFDVTDKDGSTSTIAETVASLAVTKDEWWDVVINILPCKSDTGGACGTGGVNGFFKIYVSNATRRAASAPNDELTPVYSDTGINTSGTIHDVAINYYKYPWHCTYEGPGYGGTGDARANYSFCMTNPNSTIQPDTRTIYFDNVKVASADGSYNDPTDLISDFSAGGSAPSGSSITAMNGGNALDVNDYINWTGNGTDVTGVTAVSISDGTNSESADAFVSNWHGSGTNGGGCFTTGDLTSLSGGPVTVSVSFDPPDYDSDDGYPGYTSQDLTSWNTSNATIASYTGSDACFNWGKPITITNNAGAALVNMESADHLTTTSGDNLTARFQIEPDATNPTTDYRLRIQCTGGTYEVRNTSGTWANYTTTLGTPTTPTIQTSRGFTFVTMRTNSVGTDTSCQLKAGIHSTGTKAMRLYHATLTKNESASTITYQTTLNKPDTTAPVLECDMAKVTSSSATLSCDLSELNVTVYSVITESSTQPTCTQIIAGQNESGGTALFSDTQTLTGTTYGVTTGSVLNPYVDKYAHFCGDDASANRSSVTTADTSIEAETPVTKSIKFDATNGYLRRGGALFTGTFDNFKLYDKDPLRYGQYHATDNPNGASLLVHASSVSVTSGALSLVEADLTSGSINGLEAATNYWFYAFDNDKDPFAFGEIQITVE